MALLADCTWYVWVPLLQMSLQKSPLFRGGADIRTDERAKLIYRLLTTDKRLTMRYAKPLLLAIHSMSSQAGTPLPAGADATGVRFTGNRRIVLPESEPLRSSALQADKLLLFDDGSEMYLWVGGGVSPALLEALFGVGSLDGINVSQMILPRQPNDLSARLNAIIDALQDNTLQRQSLRIVRQGGGGFEAHFMWRLIEDPANFSGGAAAYDDYVAMVVRESQSRANPMGIPQ